MEGVDDQSGALSGGDSDFKRRVELDALKGQLGRSENSQLTFGQVTDRQHSLGGGRGGARGLRFGDHDVMVNLNRLFNKAFNF